MGPGKLSNLHSSQRVLRWSAPLLLLCSSLPAFAHKSEAWARSQYTAASRMREALNGRPAEERTRHEYQQVISSYRQVYYGAPNSTKADPSVVATAELMVEMGRQFEDDSILHSAVGQYEFLRREYPGSRCRFDALFAIGEIYQDDLHNSSRAQATFEDFLRRYPRHHLADDARKQLADQQQALKNKNEEAEDPSSQDSERTVSSDKNNKLARVTGIRHWSTPDYTRVAIDLEQDVKFDSQRIANPDRIFFDLRDTKLASTLVGKTFDVDDGFLKKIRVAQFERGRTRVVLEVDEFSEYKAFLLPNPTRLIIDIHGDSHGNDNRSQHEANASTGDDLISPPAPADISKKIGPQLAKLDPVLHPRSDPQPSHLQGKEAGSTGIKKTVVEADDEDDDANAIPDAAQSKRTEKASITPASDRAQLRIPRSGREARPTASGERSLIRALGLKIGKIVIDPGHGGHDAGTVGPNGLEEKDLVLDVSKRLGKLLETRLGAEVEFTRRDDTFIPLETRTAIANQDQADLFVSVHANSSHDRNARGVETYYLNFTSSAEALEVAARENAVSETSIHELQDLVKKIALKEKIEESREFASDVETALHSGLAAKNPGLRDRGVKKAPFIVLIGANMPSILAEISFVSNPADERRLRTSEYRQRIAESLYRGIAKYVGGLSGVKVASKIDKSSGQ